MWRHSSDLGTGDESTFVTLSLTGTVGTTLSVVAVMLQADWLTDAWMAIAASIAVAGLTAATALTPWLQRSTRSVAGSSVAPVLMRTFALVVVAALWVGAARPSLAVLAWPVGVLIGAEALAVGRLIGRDSSPRELVSFYVFSPLHLGLATACLLLWALGPDDLTGPAATAFLSIEVAWVTAGLVHLAAGRALLHEHDEQLLTEQRVQQAEARHRAHWIHDDVCAEIRQLRLRIAQIHLDDPTLSDELNAFESRVRERQLDEVIAGGEVTAAEVLQPYVRKAQSAGITILAVPNFDQASIALDPDDARILKRCVAGFVANAIDAGATTLAFALETKDHSLRLEVTDDAGGFELSTVPAGRGLWALRSSLGERNLTAIPTVSGTTMVAVMPLEHTS